MKKKKVLVLGGGGREHALCWKLSQSPKVEQLFCIPGNAGIQELAQTDASISPIDFPAIKQFALQHQIELIVVGPEQTLVMGIKDYFEDSNIQVFGPDRHSAQLEGSKIFTKNFFSKFDIPTPSYKTFFTLDDALYHIHTHEVYPIVIKADGLASGKGVVIAHSEEDAVNSIKEMMEHKKFKSAGDKIIIEEYIEGPEISYQVILDGSHFVELQVSQDFKKAYEENLGPNTGGMGNLCPPSWADASILQQGKEMIVQKIAHFLPREGINFNGVLFTGMIMSKTGLKALEINVRFGDPELQTILPLLKTDLMDLIESCHEHRLDQLKLEWENLYSSCVVLCSEGYPDKELSLGHEIHGITEAKAMEGVLVFHAGTQLQNGKLVNQGGRVLNVVGLGKTTEEASRKAYSAIEKISFNGMSFRKDIR
jgi:phosphoribosylamine---glycine ligase